MRCLRTLVMFGGLLSCTKGAMKAQFQFQRGDYKTLLHVRPGATGRKVIHGLTLVVGFPLLVVGAVGMYFVRPHFSSGWTIVAGLGVVLVVGRTLILWAEMARQYKGPQEVEVEIQDSCIDVKSSTRTGRYNWSDFSHFRSTANHFILFFPDDALLLPKRAFSIEERNMLNSLLWRNLPDRVPTSHSGL